MKRVLRILMTVCLLCGIAFALEPKEQAMAATEYKTIELTKSDVSADAASAIQTALNEARDNATEKTPYKIVVPEGTYTLSSGLRIYSNTWLYASGVTFKKTASSTANMIHVGDSNDTQVGYYYSNIIVEGATFDAQDGTNTVAKVAHASDVTIKDCTFKNTQDAHLMEIAGIKDFTVDGCTFANQVITGTSEDRDEAIQIDILETYHYPGYREEDLANKNIVIKDSTFKNVPRGIGSHTTILNNPVDGVTITGCTFKNLTSVAIQSLNWINVNISDNTIKSVPRGIAIYSIRSEGVYLASTLASEGDTSASVSDSYAKLLSNQNIVISDNTISTSGTDPTASYEEGGIIVTGLTLSKASTGNSLKDGTGDSVPAGDYYVSGITISGNTINTKGHGIRLSTTKKATVSGNTITYKGSSSSSTTYYGIQVREACSGVVIKKNTVKNTMSHGIFINGSSKVTKLNSNKIESAKGSGIRVEASAKVTALNSNTIKKPGENGIYVYDSANVKNMKKNKITSAAKYGIDVQGATVTTVESNKITSCAVNGIYVYNSGKVTSITKNVITSAGKYGIGVDKSSTATTISENEITSSVNHGIFVQDGSKIATIQSNKIKECGGRGISVNSLKCNLLITGNTISKCKSDALIFLNPATTSYTITVTKNTLTGSSSSAYKAVNGIYATGCKVSVSGNKISSTNKAISFTNTVKGTLGSNSYSGNRSSNTYYI